MKRTGELLKKTREERGMSLHEVALYLKINSRVLMAIEEGDQSQLPARTFLRGFIQSYAKFLKLDSNHVLQIFAEENGILVEAPVQALTEIQPATLNTQPAPVETEVKNEASATELEKSILTKSQVTQDKLQFKTIAISVSGLILVGILYAANNMIQKYKKEAVVEPVPTLQQVESEDAAPEIVNEPTPTVATAAPVSVEPQKPVHQPEPVVSEKEPVNHSIGVTSTPILISSPSIAISKAPGHPLSTEPVSNPIMPTLNLSENKKVEDSKPKEPAPQPTNTPVEPTKPVETVAAAPVPPPVPAAQQPVAEGKPVEVIVEAKDSVEIEYSSSRSSPQKLILKADQIHTFKSKSGIRLKISNGGAVNIIMNGRDLGAPGALGQSIQVTY